MAAILLVEDDQSIVRFLSAFLAEEGFEIQSASGRAGAMEHLKMSSFDLALLDISLTDGNGFSLCSEIKKEYGIPVVFLSASGDEFSVVTGLDLGADDYIQKPFRPRELVSRIRSVLRRNRRGSSLLELGDIKVDPEKALVTKAGEEIYLSALEYRLLLVFMNNKGMVLSRARLLEELWDIAGEYVNDNTLTVYIKRLRDKIEEDPQLPKLIHTVRGLGYRAEVE